MVIDCSDLETAGAFWTRVLGYTDEGEGSTRYRTLLPEDGVGIEVLLQKVSDPKSQKNRLHLDLRTTDLVAEVRRVVELGATVRTDVPHSEYGWEWHVLADPDGNEFCVIAPPPDYW